MPPPVSRISASRENTMRGFARALRWDSMTSARWWVLTTISCTPMAPRRSITVSIMGLPATGTIGLGTVSVSGRRRVPKPAASTMARDGMAAAERLAGGALLRALSATSCASRARGSGDMAIEPGADKGEDRVGEIIFDMFPGARDVLLIAGFAVAQQEAAEGAEDARVALGADDGVARIEGVAVETGEGREV